MATVAKAMELMAQRHGDRMDKGGHPYVLHPMRIAMKCTTPVRIQIGLMHDLIEDEGVTYDELRALGFNEEVIAGLDGVTHIPGESYPAFIIRGSKNEDSKEVKTFDLDDNMDVRRLPTPITPRSMKNILKYQVSHAFLTGKISEQEYLDVCAVHKIS